MEQIPRSTSLLTGIVLAAAGFFAGCGPNTFPKQFKKNMTEDYKLTQDMAEVGYVPAARKRWFVKDENGQYKPNYKTVGLDEQLERLESIGRDLNQWLSADNMYSDYTQRRGLIPHFRFEEKRNDYQQRQLKRIKTYLEFMDAMGYSSYDSELENMMKQYDITVLFSDPAFDAKLALKCKEVDNAKVKHVLRKREFADMFYYEVPNPEFPYKDRLNQTRKIEISEGFVIYGYDFNDPKDDVLDYVECFRKRKDGKYESLPAMKIYKSMRSRNPDVVVIDTDREGERGFGTPDKVIKLAYPISDAAQLSNKKSLLMQMFPNNLKLDRIVPVVAMRDVEIAPVGSLEQKLWVYSAKGYEVYGDYKNEKENNYTLGYTHDPESIQTMIGEDPKKPKRWYFSKNFDSNNEAIEYYQLKPEYRKSEINIKDISILGEGPKDYVISITYKDGSVDQGTPELFMCKEPVIVGFNYGKYRDIIRDADGKAPKFELMLRKAKPLTPEELKVMPESPETPF